MQTKDLQKIDEIFEDIRVAINEASGETVLTPCDTRDSYASKIFQLSDNEGVLPHLFSAVVEDDNAETPDVNYSVDENGIGVFSFRLSRGLTGAPGADGANGKDGRDGSDGKDGEKGEKGDPGADGKDGNRFKFIYLALPDVMEVSTPIYDPDKDTELPEFNGVSWTEEPTGVSIAKQIEYVSQSELTATGWSRWSDPAVWARFSKDGENGKDGVDGKDGADGKDGVGRSIFIYTSTATTDAPDQPMGGSWDPETNTVTPPEGWFDNVPEQRETYLWLSNAFFANDGTTIEGWTTPVRLTGENGQDGVDGTNIEFIYRLLPNRDTYTALREFLAENPLTSGGDLEVPEVNDELGLDSEWTNNPEGIDGGNYLIEVVCSRSKINGTWTSWSLPTYWSMWGEDGMDGAGVEYIFRITSEEFTSDMLLAEFSQHNIYNHLDYQKDNFYPGNEWGIDLDWTDEPCDVSETEPLEWVCLRKKIDGVWSEFTKPRIWGKYAKDGYAFKTSYVFTRAISQPTTPNGGTYNEPYPTILGPDGVTIQKDTVWSDTVPAGLGEIYMTYRTFYSGPEIVDADWSTPVKMTDTAGFQVEYSTKIEQPAIGSLQPYYENYINGVDTREYEIVWREDNTAWSDDGTNAVWMATSVLKNGKWTDWSVVKIKGETGTAGKDGTSIEIKGTAVEVFDALPDTLLVDEAGNEIHYVLFNDWIYKFNPETDTYEKFEAEEIGDGFVVGRNFWIWDGYRWYNAGEIKGADGDSAWFVVKFSDDKINFTADNGTEPGRYIGMLFGVGAMDENYVNTASNYDWTVWSGEDGWGWEQIFLLTAKDSGYNEDNPPALPTDNTKVLDYVPDGWTDTPGSVSSDFPYCWSAKRKASRSEIENWKGDPKKPGYASLYSRYSYDGKDGINSYHLELTNDQIIVPVEKDGSIDPDFAGGFTRMILYCGDEVVESNDEKPITYSVSVGTVNDGDVILTAEDLKDVSEVTCNATYNGTDFWKTLHVVKTDTAYDITVNRAVLTRGEDGYFIEGDKEVIVTILRWNADHWYGIDNQGFKVSITHLDGTVDTDESYITTNGKAIVTLSDEQDVRSIKIYFTKNDIEYFEEIGVIADGNEGPQGPVGPEGPEGPKGESGKDAFAFDLTNDNDTILADSEGNIIGDLPQTTAKLYLGNVLVETGIDYTVTVIGGTLSGDTNRTNKGVETFAFESITEDKAVMTIKAVYAGIEYEKNFTITRVVGTADYNLHLSNYVISRNDDTTKIVTITAEKVENGEITACTFGESILVKASNEDGETKDLTEYLVDNQYKVPYSVVIDYPIFSLYVDGVNWHTQQVAIIRDGVDGAKGENGENTIIMALSNPSGTFQYSGDNWVASSAEITSDILVLDGKTDVTSECELSYSATEGLGVVLENNTITVTPGTIAVAPGKHEVLITAVYESVSLSKVLTVICATSGGDSAVMIDLDNEVIQLVASDNYVIENKPISTNFFGYYGTGECDSIDLIDVTINDVVYTTDNENVTVTDNNLVLGYALIENWAKDNTTNELTIYLNFNVTFGGNRQVQRSVKWIVRKTSTWLRLVVNPSAIKDTDEDKTITVSLSAGYYNWDGLTPDGFNVYANGTLLNETTYTPTGTTYFELKDKEGNLWDAETVPYLFDGKDGAQGEPGKDGNTPYIQEGYWWINGVSTNIKAEGVDGENGVTPTIKNDTWWIGDTDTGVPVTGIGVESVDTEYAFSTSKTTAPTTGWKSEAAGWSENDYIWSRTKTVYSNGDVSYSAAACISGEDGENGTAGAPGASIATVVEEYYLSTSSTELSDGEWLTSYDSSMDDGLFVWTRTIITFTDDREPIVTEAIRASGLPGADGEKGEKGEDGEHSVDYKVTTSHFFVVWSANGEVITPVDDITFKVIKTVGADISQLYNLTADNLALWLDLGGDISRIDILENSAISPAQITNYLTLYLCPSSITSFDAAKVNYLSMTEVKAVHQEKGDPGENGTSGPVIYPAGEFDLSKAENGEYVGTSKKAPYVFYNPSNGIGKGYYIAYGTPLEEPIINDNILDNDAEIDWNNIPEDAASWVEMEKYNAIYSDIGIFGSVLVGKWVFEGDYMYSQLGMNSETLEEASYDLWLGNPIPSGEFIPNIKINARTGEAWFARQNFELGSDGSIKLKNGDVDIRKMFINSDIQFKIDDDGILISYKKTGESESSIQVTSDGIKIGAFFISETGGLIYSNEEGEIIIDPTNISITDVAGVVNIMQNNGTECVYVNPNIVKSSTNRIIGFRAESASVAFQADDSETAFQANKGVFSGLRPKYTETSTSVYNVDGTDHTIICTSTSTQTIYLNNAEIDGQELEIWKINKNDIVISSSKNITWHGKSQSSTQTVSGSHYGTIKLLYDGTEWRMLYLSQTV